MEELRLIMEKFAVSGWELIANPAKGWLAGDEDTKLLIEAIKKADLKCGDCGCELDGLYKRALLLLSTFSR